MIAGRVLIVLALAAVLAASAGFYVNYRDQQTAKVDRITSLEQIRDVTPTVCTYQIGAYGAGSSGEMYIANNEIRVEVPDLQINGYSGSVEAIIGLDGTRLIDPKSLHSLSGGNGAPFAINMVITKAPWKCSPWWFSDNGLFTIPNAVTF
ncbi:MAG TPA: hypothetical protein VMH91_03945 [Candidatus Paceibacterota bacterium]|nr:hypothetical protein [Candidatus Paceibacterota bacterium]